MDTTATGSISYRETYDQQTLLWASRQITRFIWKEFVVSQAIVVTYLGVPAKSSNDLMSFQAVLASNGKETYAITYYKWHKGIRFHGLMGYSNALCDWNWFRGRGDSMKTTYLYTNTGLVGQYIYLVSTKRCINEGKVIESKGVYSNFLISAHIKAAIVECSPPVRKVAYSNPSWVRSET